MNSEQDKVNVEIYTKATTTVVLGDGETLNDISRRDVDVYLHGSGAQGHMDKDDIGSYSTVFKVNSEDELLLVDKGLLLALIDTAYRTTDLESVCDDTRSTSYPWDKINDLIYGMDSGELKNYSGIENKSPDISALTGIDGIELNQAENEKVENISPTR
jgi:hypothetical protein